MNYQFFKLTGKQVAEFENLKNAGYTSKHGPLALGQKVPMHTHGEKAMYMVKGVAQFTGTMVRKVLGKGRRLNAVMVSARQEHGWLGKFDGTEIDQVFGSSLVNKVLAV